MEYHLSRSYPSRSSFLLAMITFNAQGSLYPLAISSLMVEIVAYWILIHTAPRRQDRPMDTLHLSSANNW